MNTTYGVPATVQNYRYDAAGNVKRHTQSIGTESYLQEYTYNLAGQLTSQKLPSGRVVENEIDDFGRLAGVSDSNREYLTDVSFNAKGLLSQLDLGNGDHETFSYNSRLQMSSQSLIKGATVLQKYDYGYGEVDGSGTLDPNRNNGQLGTIDSYIGTSKQWTQKFLYDSIGRLKQAAEYRNGTTLSYKQVFDYDRFGNLYRKADHNGTSGQEDPLPYTAIEESTTSSNGDIDKATNRFRTETTYNEAGMVTADDKFRDMGFAYDANGRMVKATKTSTPDAQTVYDALGNRVATKVNDVWRFMIYDAFGRLAAEYGQADEGMGGVNYIQQDWQGSVRTVSNANGYVTSRTDHTAFGETVGAAVGLRSTLQGYVGTTQTRQGYGLTEQDDATGLDHTWFRKSEGSAGRWTSPDPYNGSMDLGGPQSFNRYSYVANQPTNFVDPSGLYEGAPCSGGRAVYDSNGNFVRWDCPSTTIIVIIWDIPSPIPSPPPDHGGVDGGGGGTEPSGPRPQQPCPPTGQQLVNDPTVIRALQKAWRESRIGTREGFRREQGGWLYARNGRIIIRRASPGLSANIDLSNPPQIAGALLVGTFHSHPGFASQGFDPNASIDDVILAYARNVPGLLVSEGMLISSYGPIRRGSDPRYADDPNNSPHDRARGYPGNTANTQGCSGTF